LIMIRQFILILIFCLPAIIWSQTPIKDYPNLIYPKNVELNVLEYGDDFFRFEIINNNETVDPDINSDVMISRWIALPQSSRFTWELEEIDWLIEWEEGEVEGPLTINDQYSRGSLPTTLANGTGNIFDQFRGVGFGKFEYSLIDVISRNISTYERGYLITRRAVVRIDITGGSLDDSAWLTNLSEEDPYLEEMSEHLVLNKEHVQQFTRPQPEIDDLKRISKWNGTLASASNEAPVLFAKVSKPGFYRLLPNDLQRIGISPAVFVGSSIQVYAGDRRLPVLADGVSRGPFIDQSSLTFYVPENKVERRPYIPVWITQLPEGDGDVPEIKFTEQLVGEQLDPSEYSITATKEVFEPNFFNHRFRFLPDTGRWVTAQIPQGELQTFEFELLKLDDTKAADLNLTFAGGASNEFCVVEVFVNGEMVQDNRRLNGSGPFNVNIKLKPGLLKQGINTFSVRYPEERDERFTSLRNVFFGKAEIQYQVEAKDLPFGIPLVVKGKEGTNLRIDVRNITSDRSDRYYFLDITDEYNPTLLGNARQGGGRTAALEITQTPKTIYIASDSSINYFGDFENYNHREILEPESGADIVHITHPRFQYALDSYVRRRDNQGFDVKIVTTDEIYSVFGYGNLGYEPIHDFIKHAYTAWPDRKLSRVLLIGEASEYWWELTHPRDGIAENLMPVYGFADPNISVRGDAAYGWVSGTGYLDDIEIGRISIDNIEELNEILERSESYENVVPQSPWMKRHIFITDDEPEFAEVADKIISSELFKSTDPKRIYLQDHAYEDYFRIFNRKRSIEMTQNILKSLSEGALTATYLGHGGPNLWSAERILHYRDLYELENNGVRPIMLAGSCDTAWVDYPTDPVERSIGEQFLSNDKGGGIALFAPVAGTNSYEHDFLLRAFFDGLITQELERVGQVAMYSRLRYMLERNQNYVTRQFILMGDPLLEIPRSEKGFSLEITPGYATTNSNTKFELSGKIADLSWGLVKATVYDRKGLEVSGPVYGHVRGGEFQLNLQMPPYVDAGEHRINVEAYNEHQAVYRHVEYVLDVIEPKVKLSWETDRPIENNVPAGTPIQLVLTVENQSQGPLPDVGLAIEDASTGNQLTATTISLQDKEVREFKFPLPVPAGISLIDAVTSYSFDEAEKDVILDQSRFEVRGVSDENEAVAVPTKLIKTIRTASPDSTSFSIPVYNLLDEQLRSVSARLYLLDSEEGSLIGESDDILRLAPFGITNVKFSEPTIFPPGKYSFRLELETPDGPDIIDVSQTIEFPLEISPGNDIMIVPGSVRTERETYRKGETVFLTATLKNNGDETINSCISNIYLRFPWDPDSLASSLTGAHVHRLQTPLAPGEERQIRMRWDPDVTETHIGRVFVVANSNRSFIESDYVNNVENVSINLRKQPNLSLDLEHTTIEPQNALAGDIISINIRYENMSDYDFSHPFVIEVVARGEGHPTEPVYRTTVDALDVNEQGVIQATWKADGKRDNIIVSVNAEKEYGEEQYSDNTKAMTISYVIPYQYLLTENDEIELQNSFKFGKFRNLFLTPANGLAIEEYPKSGEIINFSNEYLVHGNPLPTELPGTENDNRMSIIGGGLNWTPYENVPPAFFSFPMNQEDETTVYDVYISQLREMRRANRPTNKYRYRIEGNKGWESNDVAGDTKPYLGRIDTKDDMLDIIFSQDPQIPSFNTIGHIDVRPVRGEFLSSYYQVDGLPRGSFEAELNIPERTQISMWYRFGDGTHQEPNLTDWIYVPFGETIEAAPEAKLLQVKVALTGAKNDTPTMNGLMFIPSESKSKIAEVGN